MHIMHTFVCCIDEHLLSPVERSVVGWEHDRNDKELTGGKHEGRTLRNQAGYGTLCLQAEIERESLLKL